MISIKQSDTVVYETHTVTYVSDMSYSATLYPGKYKFECWGAQGAHVLKDGGRGAYTSGEIHLSQTRTFYLFPGQEGKVNSGKSFNGGGKGGKTNADYWISHPNANAGSGGGASDIRLLNDIWNNTKSLKSRIIVAAGGGGFCNYHLNNDNEVPGSPGGTIKAKEASYSQCIGCSNSEAGQIKLAQGGAQSPGDDVKNGALGLGGDFQVSMGGGGGGGYFGGQGGYEAYHRYGAGAGGSSFISGHQGCYAFPSENSETTSQSTNVHFSGLFFVNTVMKGGDEPMPAPNGGTENGHSGNGVIRITVLSITMRTCRFLSHHLSFSMFLITFMK